MTEPAGADLLAIENSSSNQTEQVTLDILKAWMGIGSGWLGVTDTWTWASSDAPNYVITVPSGATSIYSPGMRVRLTHGAAVKYFIIVAVTNTTITVYGGTDYTLSNTAFSNISVAVVKAPFGFPLNPLKWTVLVTDTTLRIQNSPTNGTWYNIGTVKITVPIGSWNLKYRGDMQPAKGSSSSFDMRTSLSTSASSESDSRFTSFIALSYVSAVGSDIIMPFDCEAIVNPTSKTDYFAIMKTTTGSMTAIHLRNDLDPMSIRAVCAYL